MRQQVIAELKKAAQGYNALGARWETIIDMGFFITWSKKAFFPSCYCNALSVKRISVLLSLVPDRYDVGITKGCCLGSM